MEIWRLCLQCGVKVWCIAEYLGFDGGKFTEIL